tara:strand:- start:1038 stop:1619 length:582 start_codon:yes stop_codon:yes gene_type:complete
MRMERIELCADVSTDVLAVVWLIGLPQQKGVRPVVGDAVLSVEVRVTGSNDPFARQEASVAVVRVQPIPFPRIVTEYDLRLELANRLGDVAPLAQAAVEFAVDVLEEAHLTGDRSDTSSEPCSGIALFDLATGRERNRVGTSIPCAFGSVGADKVVNDATVSSPLCQGSATSELDVVGMRSDCQRRLRCGVIE